MNKDIRWKQRFDNFAQVYLLLREAFARGVAPLSQLEKEGAIQRFEMTFELAWKTMSDYLQESGLELRPVTLRKVIKEAFAARILENAQEWIDMMLHRNLLSHTYDSKGFEEVLQAVDKRYLSAFERLHVFFMGEPV